MGKLMHSITLGQDESEYARNLPNFSGFVRECLKRHMLGELVVDWDQIEIRAKDRKAFEFTSAIDRRLANIENMISELKEKI